MHWGNNLLRGKTVQGSCQQFLQNHFREAVCQVDKRMKKWRNAKGRERKKQSQSNSAYTSSSFKRINIHVSIPNHCTVIINCFAAKLSAISLNSSYDFKLIKLSKINFKNPLQLLHKSLFSKLSANQICSILTLHGWGKSAALVQMSSPTVCCDSLFLPLRDCPSWGRQSSHSGSLLPAPGLLSLCSAAPQKSLLFSTLPTSAHPTGWVTWAKQSLLGQGKVKRLFLTFLLSQPSKGHFVERETVPKELECLSICFPSG